MRATSNLQDTTHALDVTQHTHARVEAWVLDDSRNPLTHASAATPSLKQRLMRRQRRATNNVAGNYVCDTGCNTACNNACDEKCKKGCDALGWSCDDSCNKGCDPGTEAKDSCDDGCKTGCKCQAGHFPVFTGATPRTLSRCAPCPNGKYRAFAVATPGQVCTTKLAACAENKELKKGVDAEKTKDNNRYWHPAQDLC